MSLIEILRSHARQYRCPVCQESMADCGLSVLLQKGNEALVRVTCAECHDENLLQVVLQEGPAEAPRRLVDEGGEAPAEPIASDELLDLHNLLAEHDGDLVSLLG